MSTRRKVKTIRAACGRHRYLIIAGHLPILLSKPKFRSVGDAKSAGKAHSRLLGRVDGRAPLHIQLRGLCIECLYHGKERQAVRLENAGTASVLCKQCWEVRHPGHLQRTGVA